jgi:hypothetical protein
VLKRGILASRGSSSHWHIIVSDTHLNYCRRTVTQIACLFVSKFCLSIIEVTNMAFSSTQSNSLNNWTKGSFTGMIQYMSDTVLTKSLSTEQKAHKLQYCPPIFRLIKSLLSLDPKHQPLN